MSKKHLNSFLLLSKTKKCSKSPKLLKHSIYPKNSNNDKEKIESNTCKKSTYGVKYKYIGNNIRKIKKTRVFCKKKHNTNKQVLRQGRMK